MIFNKDSDDYIVVDKKDLNEFVEQNRLGRVDGFDQDECCSQRYD